MIRRNLLDVRVPVKIRVGTKVLTLDEMNALSTGSVVELNQLANNPLMIVVDDVVIAEGEVVIVDGMYGVQITKIYDEAILGNDDETRY